jgi:hypothetical protein
MPVDTTHLKLRSGDRVLSTPSSLLPASTTMARREVLGTEVGISEAEEDLEGVAAKARRVRSRA